jgi:Pyruvate/2-oxoacid:ferredoxin oxidoreductase gamma subunit
VLLGALSTLLHVPGANWLQAIEFHVPPKFLELNFEAFEAGRRAVADQG